MAYNRKDGFFHKAQKEGFAARSIYKLEAIEFFVPNQLLRAGAPRSYEEVVERPRVVELSWRTRRLGQGRRAVEDRGWGTAGARTVGYHLDGVVD